MAVFDRGMLPWYHGLEFFDSLRWVLMVDEPTKQHTAKSPCADLTRWIETH